MNTKHSLDLKNRTESRPSKKKKPNTSRGVVSSYTDSLFQTNNKNSPPPSLSTLQPIVGGLRQPVLFQTNNTPPILTLPEQTTSINSNQPTTTPKQLVISFAEYFNWNPQQVTSVLCAPKQVKEILLQHEEQGGAGLTDDDFQPLFDINFDGSNLYILVQDIKKHGEDGAVDRMVNNKDFTKVSQSTCETVLGWVSNHLMAPPKQIEDLKPQQVKEILLQHEEQGGAGLTDDKVQPLFDINFDGSNLYILVQDIKKHGEDGAVVQMVNNKDFTKVSQSTCQQVVNWVSNHLMAPPKQIQRWSPQQLSQLLQLDKGIGGAGLSRNQGESLINAKFDGKKLEEIAHKMQTKGEVIALEQLKETTESVDETCKAVVEWLRNNYPLICVTLPKSFIDTTTMITPEYIKKARNDPLYDYLRNTNPSKFLDELETKIGQNIPLPKLGEIGSDHVPKDYDPSIPYLLTRQRYEVLKKVIERKEGGFILSGPHGISKSYTMCLLAAYAIVNSIPLLYVPVCGDWVEQYNDGGMAEANDYLCSLVFLWNSDILSEYDIKKLKSRVNVVDYMSKNIAKNKPVFYLFDEHDELYRQNTEGIMAATENYFMAFTRWTRVTRGDKTMTIYCGSAHIYLPGGAESKIIRVVPPTVEEFETLVQNFGLSLSDYNRIEYATGRIPIELKLLVKFLHENETSVNDQVIQNFIAQQENVFEQRLYSLIKSLNKGELDKLHLLLEGLFTLGLYKGKGPSACLGTVYEKGLLYYGVNGKLYVINESAKRVLFAYYCEHAPIPVMP